MHCCRGAWNLGFRGQPVTTPTNVDGHLVEYYTHALGWKPFTQRVDRRATAEKQCARLLRSLKPIKPTEARDMETPYRVYWAFK